MRSSYENNTNRLQEMRSHHEVRERISNRESKEGIHLRGVSTESSSRESNHRASKSGKEDSGRRIKKTCSICGLEFKVSEEEKWKTQCNDCSSVMRDIHMSCAKCGNQFPIRRLELLSMRFSPGQKGGNLYKLRYCALCFAEMKSRANKLFTKQDTEYQQAAKKQRRYMREMVLG